MNSNFKDINKKNKNGWFSPLPGVKFKRISEKIEGSSKKVWVQIENEKYLAKSLIFDDHIIYGPLLFKKLSKQISLNCLEYFPFEYRKNKYLISKNFIKENEIFFTANDLANKYITKKRRKNTFAECLNNLDDLKITLFELFPFISKSDMNKIKDQLIKMFIVDILVRNTDRHGDNYGFLVDRKNKTIRLAPIYDNDYIFNFIYSKDVLKRELSNKNYNIFEKSYIRMADTNFSLLGGENKTKMFTLLEELGLFALQSPLKRRKKLLKIIENVNIDKTILEVKKDMNNNIPYYI